jgi:hypothetical protein
MMIIVDYEAGYDDFVVDVDVDVDVDHGDDVDNNGDNANFL